MIKRKITDLDKMKIEEQKKAVRAGYDMDIIPSDINTFGIDAKKLLEDLQGRNERMFLVTVLIMNTAKTKKALNSAIFEVQSIAQQRNCPLRRLDYQQEDGLMASRAYRHKQYRNPAGFDNFKHRYFCAVHYAGAFFGQPRSVILRTKRTFKQYVMVDRKMLKKS